jgi:hypothetical protein
VDLVNVLLIGGFLLGLVVLCVASVVWVCVMLYRVMAGYFGDLTDLSEETR